MGPELLIPLLAPVVTEAIKKLFGWIFNDVPPVLVPLISAVVGGVMGAVPDVHSTVLEGVELGLAGTGLHQTARVAGLTKRTRLTRTTDQH